jgi:hypothetical protein
MLPPSGDIRMNTIRDQVGDITDMIFVGRRASCPPEKATCVAQCRSHLTLAGRVACLNAL